MRESTARRRTGLGRKAPAITTTTTTQASETPRPQRTPEEQAILDVVARSRGQEFADKFAELILAQAREIGDL